ncbi:MAG: universal stress protein [Acidimicrobiia bacterium]
MTRTVLAFVEDGPTAAPVIAMAKVLGFILSGDVEAVHVGDDLGASTVEEASSAGVPVRIESGDPLERIVAEVSSSAVVAGVVGARGERAGPRPVGGTALEMITRADKLVAVVPPQAVVSTPNEVDRILMPLDGTASSAKAIRVLGETCARHGIEIVVLHVFDSSTAPPFWDQPFHDAEAFASEFLARFMAQPEAKMTLRAGTAREGVIDAATRESADLIALGWSQHLDPGRAEVVRHVLSEASVPVLLVPTE